MLNISKISKMLLISGLVLAFSSVTFDAGLAYAASQECTKAQKQLKEAQKKKVDDDANVKTAQKALDNAKTALDAAKSSCTTALQYCSAYQAAKASHDNAVKNFAHTHTHRCAQMITYKMCQYQYSDYDIP